MIVRAGAQVGRGTGREAHRLEGGQAGWLIVEAGGQARRETGMRAGRCAGAQAGRCAGAQAGRRAGAQAERRAGREARRRTAGRQAGSPPCRARPTTRLRVSLRLGPAVSVGWHPRAAGTRTDPPKSGWQGTCCPIRSPWTHCVCVVRCRLNGKEHSVFTGVAIIHCCSEGTCCLPRPGATAGEAGRPAAPGPLCPAVRTLPRLLPAKVWAASGLGSLPAEYL